MTQERGEYHSRKARKQLHDVRGKGGYTERPTAKQRFLVEPLHERETNAAIRRRVLRPHHYDLLPPRDTERARQMAESERLFHALDFHLPIETPQEHGHGYGQARHLGKRGE